MTCGEFDANLMSMVRRHPRSTNHCNWNLPTQRHPLIVEETPELAEDDTLLVLVTMYIPVMRTSGCRRGGNECDRAQPTRSSRMEAHSYKGLSRSKHKRVPACGPCTRLKWQFDVHELLKNRENLKVTIHVVNSGL